MARLSLDETPGRSAHINQDFERDATRIFRAIFDAADDEIYVLANCGFSINQLHPSYAGLVITEIKADLVKHGVPAPGTNTNSTLWQIELQYGTRNPLEHAIDGNPLHLPTRFSFEPATEEVPAFEDVDGNPIVNSAGDPYDPPLMRRVLRAKLKVRRNESPSAVNLPTLLALSNTLNMAAWNGFPPKTVLLEPLQLPEAEFSQVTQQFYFPFQYEFSINFDTWVKQVINAGVRELDSSGNLKQITINGQPVSNPVPLDKEGHAIMTPSFKDASADVPPDANSGGNADEPAGGAEPPEGGDGVEDGSSSTGDMIIDAYDLIRTADFSFLNMDNLFTLPST